MSTKNYTLYYYLILTIKKSDQLIDQTMADFLGRFITDKCEDLKADLLTYLILSDQVHLILSLSPTHYLPEVIQYLKDTTAHEANHAHQFRHGLSWTRAYHIETISKRHLKLTLNYVQTLSQRQPDKLPK